MSEAAPANAVECPFLAACPMFKYFSLESTKRVFISMYCRGGFADCERKKLRDRGFKPPDPLLPTGQSLTRDAWKPPQP